MSDPQPPTPGLTEPSPPMDGQGPDTATADPFNPETLRIGVTANIEVEQVLTAVPVRKPKRTEFFRVTPAPNTRWTRIYWSGIPAWIQTPIS